jgi:arylsulfatase
MKQSFCLLFSLAAMAAAPLVNAAASTPNIVIILIDDMGYADIGPFGANGYTTPNLDKMATTGAKFTNFHVAQPVCSASRTAILTGCYSNRVGIHGALGPGSKVGISDNEMTLAQLVKQKGYATCAVGKWHLGDHAQFLPTKHGFDEYLGIPYSNDMWPNHPDQKARIAKGKKGNGFPNLPMYENDKVINANVTAKDQTQLTTQYTERAVSFIERSKDKPFFLYLAHNMCHVPLFVSDKFKGKSERGLFGDVIMELDWSVGKVMDALKRTNTLDNTLVVFTSDNGPWLVYGDHAGSAGPLREGKGTCWEGGVRVPCLMQWPGHIPAGAVSDKMFMTIDLFPTIAGLVGAKLPDHKIDGLNVLPLIENQPDAKNPHDFYTFYYENNQLQAVVTGDGSWKLQLPHTYRSIETGKPGSGGLPGNYGQVPLKEAELYQVTGDIGERKDVASSNAEMRAKLEAAAEAAREDLGDSITKQEGKGQREPGRIEPVKLP